LETRWDAMTLGQRALMAAVAAEGGRATTRQLVERLGAEDSRGISRVREELLRRGDLIAPQRGVLAITTPAMTVFVREQFDGG
jgi:hypothetical protein